MINRNSTLCQVQTDPPPRVAVLCEVCERAEARLSLGFDPPGVSLPFSLCTRCAAETYAVLRTLSGSCWVTSLIDVYGEQLALA